MQTQNMRAYTNKLFGTFASKLSTEQTDHNKIHFINMTFNRTENERSGMSEREI